MSMRVLMFGWEFPPHQVGGLGVVSQELAHALTEIGVDITFVLPRRQPVDSHLQFVFADVPMESVHEEIGGVYTSSRISEFPEIENVDHMFADFIAQLYEYAHQARKMVSQFQFDVIHAHDWLTYPAGLAARAVSGKPLVVHVHNTIYDRGLGSASAIEKKIEREGICNADGVITVSEYTKHIIVEKYGVNPKKVRVVHNAVSSAVPAEYLDVLENLKKQGVGIVLYHGRITLQKGVEYFVHAAERVLHYRQNMLFIVSGSGDREREAIIEQVTRLGIAKHFLFVENAWGGDRDQLYKSADVLVMPSVSEPFGIVPLEALTQGTPVIVSKQSGVSEVLQGALKVDFWDIDEMANKILAVTEHKALRDELTKKGQEDVSVLSWHKAAQLCKEYYEYLAAA